MRRKYNKIPKLHIRKGDTVKVLSGNDKNKTGEVKRVNLKEGTAIVDGINMVTKHRKPDADNPNGSIVKLESPIRVSKLQVMVDGESTRIGRKLNENGKLQRFSKKTGDFINN
ncbi:MAG: 50S ribosomal protein L24 [Bacteroidia bacterium]|jgi:large subunit ribosomal protein L24|nr:50S ribosomal protein L24 [Bacteroidia bacterium]MDC3406811.1 50S ribosomal protein L24 [Bacteroidia bacterium]CAI8195085.1 MAG: 50S ribosomal protein L24 [Bacteroidia bacterium]